MEIIDGKALAEKIKDEIVNEVKKMGDERPNLAIVLVGEREDSKIYVDLKEKQAKLVGVDTHTYNCDEEIAEEDLLGIIEYLNRDDLIDAILLQLPLPEHLDENKIVAAIDPNKDVDGFHPAVLKKYLADEPAAVEPVVPVVVREMLKEIKFFGEGRKAVVIANSEMFGEALRHELLKFELEVEVVDANDNDLNGKIGEADLLVTAVGKPNFIKGSVLKKDAVVIDIGIAKNALGHVCGDVDFATVKDRASYITPVPGGVGPMTIAVALRNALRLKQARH
jgi:methylenetetrahydrofolate dehydrogenase (NADP+)/methenyltetrahydrofolate cyclohydrolase